MRKMSFSHVPHDQGDDSRAIGGAVRSSSEARSGGAVVDLRGASGGVLGSRHHP